MNHSLFICLLLLTRFSLCLSENAYTNLFWIKSYGGNDVDVCHSITRTNSDDLIAVGFTHSMNSQSQDVLLYRLTSSGDTVLSRVYGKSKQHECAYAIERTTTNGFIVVGSTTENGEGFITDFSVMCLDSDADTIWTKSFGRGWNDCAYSVVPNNGDGYLIGGITESYRTTLDEDIYCVYIDSIGNQKWNRTFGGTGVEYFGSLNRVKNNGYIFIGSTDSYGAGMQDFYMIRIDKYGFKLWEKTYGGASDDWGKDVCQTTDGGFVIIGDTYSYGNGGYDIYAIRTDSLGAVLWAKTYGGKEAESASSLQKRTDGGFVIVGSSNSYSGGDEDAYFLIIDGSGQQLFSKTYGGKGIDAPLSSAVTSCGGVITAGVTTSSDTRSSDFYVIQLDSNFTELSTSGTGVLSGVGSVMTQYSIKNNTLYMHYVLKQDIVLSLDVFDIKGRLLFAKKNIAISKGNGEMYCSSNDTHQLLSQGTYIITYTSGPLKSVNKLMVIN